MKTIRPFSFSVFVIFGIAAILAALAAISEAFDCMNAADTGSVMTGVAILLLLLFVIVFCSIKLYNHSLQSFQRRQHHEEHR